MSDSQGQREAPEPVCYSVPDAASILKISEGKTYGLIKDGVIRVIPGVTPKRIPGQWFRQFLKGEGA